MIIDGGILAGGLSTRMAGLDKGLQEYNGKPMASYVFESLAPHVRHVIINCNRNQSSYRKISNNICTDSIEGFQGPLAGIASIMESSDADYFLISPCDTPLLGQWYAAKMLQALQRQLKTGKGEKVIIAARDASHHHPLHLCIASYYKDSLYHAIKKGQRRVMKWILEQETVWLPFEERQEFFNFNTLEALGSAER